MRANAFCGPSGCEQVVRATGQVIGQENARFRQCKVLHTANVKRASKLSSHWVGTRAFSSPVQFCWECDMEIEFPYTMPHDTAPLREGLVSPF